jgi:hypothetical protein
MERAEAQQVRAMPFQFNALRFHQPLNRDLLLQPLDFIVGDARHSVGLLSGLFPKPVKWACSDLLFMKIAFHMLLVKKGRFLALH